MSSDSHFLGRVGVWGRSSVGVNSPPVAPTSRALAPPMGYGDEFTPSTWRSSPAVNSPTRNIPDNLSRTIPAMFSDKSKLPDTLLENCLICEESYACRFINYPCLPLFKDVTFRPEKRKITY